jgi:hypothetical protein
MTTLSGCAHRDGLIRAHDIADGRIDVEDVGWLVRGFKAYLASEGTLPLERCLHLPTGDRALRRARRDSWLRQAWDRLDSEVSAWRRSEQLAEAVRRFRTTKWPRWRALGAAPEHATRVEQALFEAFRSHERIPATAMQIHNIALQRQHG